MSWTLCIDDSKQFFEDVKGLKVLMKVEAPPSFESLLQMNGKVYGWCMTSPTDKVMTYKELIGYQNGKHNAPVDGSCPYCHDVDTWEERFGDDGEAKCSNCFSQIILEKIDENTFILKPFIMNVPIHLNSLVKEEIVS